MDPLANLREQEEVAREIHNLLDQIDEDDDLPADTASELRLLSDRLATLALAYVAWRKKGGAP